MHTRKPDTRVASWHARGLEERDAEPVAEPRDQGMTSSTLDSAVGRRGRSPCAAPRSTPAPSGVRAAGSSLPEPGSVRVPRSPLAGLRARVACGGRGPSGRAARAPRRPSALVLRDASGCVGTSTGLRASAAQPCDGGPRAPLYVGDRASKRARGFPNGGVC